MKNIGIRLMNIENNETLLKSIVWKPFLNLAIVPYVKYEDGVVGYIAKIFPNVDELFNICLDKLHKQKMVRIEINDELHLFAITNEELFLGATLMVNKENLESIHAELGDNFWILPSSIHEFLVLKDNNAVDMEGLLNIVTEINSEIVSDDDKLSDSVYYYDGEKITVFANKEVR